MKTLDSSEGWRKISEGTVGPNDLILLYAPEGNYAFIAGLNKEETIRKTPEITHYILIAEAPSVDG